MMNTRIVQVIDDLEIGGAEKLLVTFADQARIHHIDLTVISLSSNYDQIVIDELTARGAKVHILPARHLTDLKRLFQLCRFLSRGNFDLVHCHLLYANIIGSLCGWIARLPVITTLHSTMPDFGRFRGIKVLLESWIMRHLAADVIAVGYTVADANRKRLRGLPIRVILNAVSIPGRISKVERDRLRMEITGSTSRPIVISVGRFAPPKGYPDLLAAIALLRSNFPNMLLLMVGDGPLYHEIHSLAAELGLGDQVIFSGFRNDVDQLLAASDIYISSSHWEGLPLATLEAMAAGLPVITTAVGDAPQIITSEVGILVPPHQPSLLAEAIARLLDKPNEARSMGMAAREKATRDFSPDAWMDKLLVLYQGLVRNDLTRTGEENASL